MFFAKVLPEMGDYYTPCLRDQKALWADKPNDPKGMGVVNTSFYGLGLIYEESVKCNILDFNFTAFHGISTNSGRTSTRVNNDSTDIHYLPG